MDELITVLTTYTDLGVRLEHSGEAESDARQNTRRILLPGDELFSTGNAKESPERLAGDASKTRVLCVAAGRPSAYYFSFFS